MAIHYQFSKFNLGKNFGWERKDGMANGETFYRKIFKNVKKNLFKIIKRMHAVGIIYGCERCGLMNWCYDGMAIDLS
jgi:hypothetical protein